MVHEIKKNILPKILLGVSMSAIIAPRATKNKMSNTLVFPSGKNGLTAKNKATLTII